jgi:hypothetical protein
MSINIQTMRTIDKIITKVNCSYGAPMGRGEVGESPIDNTKVYDCRVPMYYDGYDRGGAYWGLPLNLRVKYTKDLSYIHFYRTY